MEAFPTGLAGRGADDGRQLKAGGDGATVVPRTSWGIQSCVMSDLWSAELVVWGVACGASLVVDGSVSGGMLGAAGAPVMTGLD